MQAPSPELADRIPRATRTFVGRTAELDRMLAAIDSEVLFVVVGVAGIGKSELVLHTLARVAVLPEWRTARFVRVALRTGMGEDDALAQLAPARTRDDALGAALAQLNAEPTIVVIEDLHVLDEAVATNLLAAIARSVHSSRVFVTSRHEVSLPVDAPTPLITRVRPLGEADSRKLVEQLAASLDVAIADVDLVIARAGGSPFFVKHQVVAARGTSGEQEDVLDRSLGELDPVARAVLLRAVTLRFPIERDRFVTAIADLPNPTEALAALTKRLLLELESGFVSSHDLVRHAAIRGATASEREAAHRWAGALHGERFVGDPVRHAVDGVEAVRHLCAAGEWSDGSAFVLRHYRAIARAGLDHLLLEPLEQLREHVVDQQFAIDLMRARSLARRSLIADARRVLDAHAKTPEAGRSVAYANLVTTVALRAGELTGAEVALARARDLATDPLVRRRVELHIADVRSLAGECAAARALLGDPPADASHAERLRWGWSVALNALMDFDFARTAAIANEARRDSGEAPDLAIQLAMLEVVAFAELGEASEAARLVDSTIAAAARASGLRARLARFYAAIAAWVSGDLVTARSVFAEVYTYLQRHRDDVQACVVGHYLGRVCNALEDHVAAQRVLEETSARATAIGMTSLAPYGRAYAIDAAFRAGRADEPAVRAAVADILATPNVRPRIAAFALRVAARATIASRDDGSVARARADLAAAAERLRPDDRVSAVALTLDRAEIELAADPTLSLTLATEAREFFRHRAVHYWETQAAMMVAAAHLMFNDPAHLVLAERALEDAAMLAERHGFARFVARVVIGRAALARRRGDADGARSLLVAALANPSPDPAVERALACALCGAGRDALAPADRRWLELVWRAAPDNEPELVVELATGTIRVASGASVRGRTILAALLARLVEAKGSVAADELYRSVWGSAEYHPLRHRSTLYSAVSRLRQVLSELVSDRGELVVTHPDGWSFRHAAISTRVTRTTE